VNLPIFTLVIQYEQDIVVARQRARQIAGLLGFDAQDQARIATSISEIARNAFTYAGGGKIEFSVDRSSEPTLFRMVVGDQGPGITHLSRILRGQYQSSTGMGHGIVGARRLMDEFTIASSPGQGTTVTMGKRLPATSPIITPAAIANIADQLARRAPDSPIEELRQQNQELLHALEELRARQEELDRLNHELEDTNRGVVALYAELEDKAEQVRMADRMKSRFLSYMGHEFRTPLNAILALSRLLVDPTASPLTEEQAKQLGFIKQAANDLLEMTNDLLDLSKVEAGKAVIQLHVFSVAETFGALRGLLRPLIHNPAVNLIFEEPDDLPPLHTDETKVTQILRNFISNAIKYTERGEIRVSASLAPAGNAIVFAVADTGIGIAPDDQARVFDEFVQVENRLQRRTKGTGLGLPLARRLAELLGGQVSVTSTLGVGSTFSAVIPLAYRGTGDAPMPNSQDSHAPSAGPRGNRTETILIVDDQEVDRYLLKRLLANEPFALVETNSGPTGIRLAREQRPRAIFLDLVMPDLSGFEVLEQLKSDVTTRDIPVIINTARILTDDERRHLHSRAVTILSKATGSHEEAVANVRDALARAGLGKHATGGGP
jgi:signal transduction histidine kinase